MSKVYEIKLEFVETGVSHIQADSFEQAKEMLIKLQILASIRRKKEKEEEEDKDTDTSKEIWSDRFVISHAVEDVGFTSYSTSYKDVMKD